VLTSATAYATETGLTVTLDSLATGPFTIEFFESDAKDPTGYGQGQTLLTRAIITTSAGHAGFIESVAPVPVGKFITATATDAAGNTSEFSAAIVVVPVATPPTATFASGGPVNEGSAGTVTFSNQ